MIKVWSKSFLNLHALFFPIYILKTDFEILIKNF